MNKYIFFTLNDFSQDDGGTVRMRGIVNALSESSESVTLISNTVMYSKFDNNVKHIFLDYYLTKHKKQFFQIILIFFPVILYKFIFNKIIYRMKNIIEKHNFNGSTIIFFEYFDNSVGYMLKKTKLIFNYINDVHGIATLEFKLKKTTSISEQFINYVKLILVKRLDHGIFTQANGLLFVSQAMQEYYEEYYPSIKKLENKIVRDGVSKELCVQKINKNNIELLRVKYGIDKNNKLILFLGDFKDLGGVIDLIEAFLLLLEREESSKYKLLLVGDGERLVDAKKIVKKNTLEEKIIFVGRILYSEVRDYQELSDVIVCPDKKHEFSELVPHIKYFDSIISGKIVINGSFKSIKEINMNEKYSIDFRPSDIVDLSNKIEYVFKNIDYLSKKYRNNSKVVCQNFSYNKSIQVFVYDNYIEKNSNKKKKNEKC